MRIANKLWSIRCFLVLAVGTLAPICSLTSPQDARLSNLPMATRDRVQFSSWWPTKGAASRQEYSGPKACSKCHASKAATQESTPMAHASSEATDSHALRSHGHLTYRMGLNHYEITTGDGESIYSVSNGSRSASVRLGWALGYNQAGETYVYNLNGKFYEGRLSYFRQLQGLDFTPGDSVSLSDNFGDLSGRLLDPNETQHCFGCHSTASTVSNQLNLPHLIPGVTCESCHGPGMQHVVAMQIENLDNDDNRIFNPRVLSPVASVEFCGACHRTKWDVIMSGLTGTVTVRFQPYRLETSRCFGPSGDTRLICFTCHDPHEPLDRDAAAYDQRCLQCHASSKRESQLSPAQAACPIGEKNCVTCHMPKIELSDMHATFTDHRIRIVRKGEDFPD
jgi:hypothetical protein